MLYLNNPLLTSDKIIVYFENNLEKLSAISDQSSHTPSSLSQLKSKLKAIFFTQLNKKATDDEVLQAIKTDMRFTANYPKLKQILKIIFTLKDTDDKKVALEQLQSNQSIDWDPVNSAAQWALLNQKYNYFDNTQEFCQFFTELAEVCRIMIVLFEENNTQEDTMAYEYAYKLMALYINGRQLNIESFDTVAKETYKLIANNDGDKSHPLHHALLVKLNLPSANTFEDKAGWQALVKSAGINAFYFLAMAEKIEKKIATKLEGSAPRAPKNMKEAKAIAALCHYRRASEDPDFAELCHRYKVTEYRFNQCLDYIASGFPKKETDIIPDIQVIGEGPAEGLYWLKLPLADKRALILGDITDCCQSIGGHSAQCVKDAVTLAENSLYVLIKKRRKGAHNLIVKGEVNDNDFKIIGQSYVWKSVSGNVCLDSIECLSYEVSDEALKSILTNFSNTLLQLNPDIKYVTLGCGGKTPVNLFDNAFLAEKIKLGYQYGDSNTQYCIAKTPYDNFNQDERIMVEYLLEPYPKNIRDLVNHFSCYIDKTTFFIAQLENIESFIEQLNILRTKYPELAESYLLDSDLEELLSNKDLITAIQKTPIEQRALTKEKMLEDACKNNDRKKVDLLLQLDVPITESLIKKINPLWVSKLIPSIEAILEKLQYVEGIHLLYEINRKKLSELILSSFIEEVDSESRDIIDENKLTTYIKNTLHKINEEKNSPIINTTNKFKIRFFELKESYNPIADYTGPSIYELD